MKPFNKLLTYSLAGWMAFTVVSRDFYSEVSGCPLSLLLIRGRDAVLC